MAALQAGRQASETVIFQQRQLHILPLSLFLQVVLLPRTVHTVPVASLPVQTPSNSQSAVAAPSFLQVPTDSPRLLLRSLAAAVLLLQQVTRSLSTGLSSACFVVRQRCDK